MKKLVITLLLTTVSLTLFAQLKPYSPNAVLNKFVGTWVAQTGKKKISITIKKIQEPFLNSKVDFLVGYLLHKDNNEIIEQDTTPVLTSGINYALNGEVFQDKVFFDYFDKRKEKRGKLILTLSKANSNEFTTNIIPVEIIRIITDSTQNKKIEKGFTLPSNILFDRQK